MNINPTAIMCPKCGYIDKNDFILYDESIKEQKIDILPINPTCKFCGSNVVINHKCQEGNLIVLNGTCGSGKTTIAEQLAKMNWNVIDGDCAIQSLRCKTGIKKYDWYELIDEIIHEIDIISLFTTNIVLSHIILPEDVEKYERAFKERNLRYKLILLKPEYKNVVERCQIRTCHTSKTPEEWIKYYYDALNFDSRFFIIDNTNMSIQETVEYILEGSIK